MMPLKRNFLLSSKVYNSLHLLLDFFFLLFFTESVFLELSNQKIELLFSLGFAIW
jgi:hypothetical protein